MKITKALLRQLILEEVEAATGDTMKGFGQGTTSKAGQAKSTLDQSKAIAKGDSLEDVDNKERAMLVQIQKALTQVAEQGDLMKYRSTLETILKRLIKDISRGQAQTK